MTEFEIMLECPHCNSNNEYNVAFNYDQTKRTVEKKCKSCNEVFIGKINIHFDISTYK